MGPPTNGGTVTTEPAIDHSMCQAALTQAGVVNRLQAEAITSLQDEARRLSNELWDWRQRYTSAAERLADVYPPALDERESKRLRELVVEMELRLAAGELERRKLMGQLDEWRHHDEKHHATPDAPSD